MRQRGNSFSDVPIRWLLEIEQDRQVIPFPKFVSDGVEDGFAFWREAAKDEDHLGSDGVDDVADFLVIQEQVDELCDFEIVR